MDERGSGNYTQTIGEIREWLVKIDTNQLHQTQLLETIKQQSENAFTKADYAEDTANEALTLATKTDAKLDKYVDDERTGRRWLIGVAITAIVALLPIYNSFYL